MSNQCRRQTLEFAALSTYILKLMLQMMDQKLSEGDVPLTPMQFTLLRHIAFEAQTIADLSRRLHLDPSTLVPVVDTLEEKGFIVRERDPNDRRRLPLSVTEDGQMLLRHHVLISDNSQLCQAFAAAGDDTMTHLLESLRQVVAQLPDGEDALQNVDWQMRTLFNAISPDNPDDN